MPSFHELPEEAEQEEKIISRNKSNVCFQTCLKFRCRELKRSRIDYIVDDIAKMLRLINMKKSIIASYSRVMMMMKPK